MVTVNGDGTNDAAGRPYIGVATPPPSPRMSSGNATGERPIAPLIVEGVAVAGQDPPPGFLTPHHPILPMVATKGQPTWD